MCPHLLCNPVRNFLRSCRLIHNVFREDDIGPRQLCSVFVGVDSDHGDIVDFRMGYQEGFQVGGCDLEPLVLDQLFDPVDDADDSWSKQVRRWCVQEACATY
jgi:hypothetical protein